MPHTINALYIPGKYSKCQANFKRKRMNDAEKEEKKRLARIMFELNRSCW